MHDSKRQKLNTEQLFEHKLNLFAKGFLKSWVIAMTIFPLAFIGLELLMLGNTLGYYLFYYVFYSLAGVLSLSLIYFTIIKQQEFRLSFVEKLIYENSNFIFFFGLVVIIILNVYTLFIENFAGGLFTLFLIPAIPFLIGIYLVGKRSVNKTIAKIESKNKKFS